jgi:predicted transcriptional regulator
MRERDEFTEREKQRQALQAEEREREQISVQDKQQINEQFADEGAALKSMSTLIEGLYDTLRDVTGDNAALKKRVAELEKKQDIPEERVATLHATNILRSFGHRSKGGNYANRKHGSMWLALAV